MNVAHIIIKRFWREEYKQKAINGERERRRDLLETVSSLMKHTFIPNILLASFILVTAKDNNTIMMGGRLTDHRNSLTSSGREGEMRDELRIKREGGREP